MRSQRGLAKRFGEGNSLVKWGGQWKASMHKGGTMLKAYNAIVGHTRIRGMAFKGLEPATWRPAEGEGIGEQEIGEAGQKLVFIRFTCYIRLHSLNYVCKFLPYWSKRLASKARNCSGWVAQKGEVGRIGFGAIGGCRGLISRSLLRSGLEISE